MTVARHAPYPDARSVTMTSSTATEVVREQSPRAVRPAAIGTVTLRVTIGDWDGFDVTITAVPRRPPFTGPDLDRTAIFNLVMNAPRTGNVSTSRSSAS